MVMMLLMHMMVVMIVMMMIMIVMMIDNFAASDFQTNKLFRLNLLRVMH